MFVCLFVCLFVCINEYVCNAADLKSDYLYDMPYSFNCSTGIRFFHLYFVYDVVREGTICGYMTLWLFL